MVSTIVTFSTDNYAPIYDKYVGESIKRLGLKPHKHYGITATGWLNATSKKANCILKELRKGNPVLYLDCDSLVMDKSVMDIDSIVPPGYIAAVHFLDWKKWFKFDTNKIEPQCAVMFFRPEAADLVKKWAKSCDNDKGEDDQICFSNCIKGFEDKIYHLPIEWCYIHSLLNGGKGGIPCDNPLIIQFQASRSMMW